MLNLMASEATWYPVLFDTPHNILRSVAIWLTLLLVIGITACFIALRKKPSFPLFKKFAFIFSISYAAVLGLTFLIFNFVEEGIVPILFIPLTILIFVVAAGMILIVLKKNQTTVLIAVSIIGAAVITTLICMAIHFSSGAAAEANWLENKDVNSVALYVFGVIAIVAVILVAIFFDKKNKFEFDTKSIAHAAVAVAMSFALSYLRIVKLPQVGSITIASLLPLMIYSYAFGLKKGVFAGLIFGLLQSVQDTYILHPAQFVLDYPAAFACIGLAVIFTNVLNLDKYPQIQFALGAVFAGVCRFIMHFLSGIFAFGTFAPEGTPVAIYSLGYQAAYVFPDLLICIFVGVILFSSKTVVGELKKLNPKAFNPPEEPVDNEDL